jgi:hypothetical protein
MGRKSGGLFEELRKILFEELRKIMENSHGQRADRLIGQKCYLTARDLAEPTLRKRKFAGIQL